MAYAVKQRIPEEKADNYCTFMESQINQHRIIDTGRLIQIIQKSHEQADGYNVQLALRLSGWKLQGTDGVRGIVSTIRVGASESLQLFLDKNIITPVFCKLYAKALGQMLKEYFSGPAISSSDNPFAYKIAFAEDGRDNYDRTSLKEGLIEGFSSLGISVEDLDIIPTPGLAAYSYKHDLPGLMLTASHNPAEYNGIKIFLDGKKLYPEGALGEYLLSWYLFSLASGEDDDSEKVNHASESFVPVINMNREGVERQILGSLSNAMSEETLNSLKSVKIVLDTANGAYTQTALKFFSQQDIEIIPLACNPGEKSINSNCGVGLLEHLNPVLTDDEKNPVIVKELFEAGRSSVSKKAYGIVLDGDGDRGFLLEYDPMVDCIRIYDGDALGFIIASGLINNDIVACKPNLQFVSTVESDVALSSAVKEKLNIQNTISCVGDRWLISELSSETEILIACERSGHVIIPYSIDENGKDTPGRILYTGNGLATVLRALSFLLTSSKENEDPEQLTFAPGFRSRIAIYNCDMSAFYRDSELWNEVDCIVRQIIPMRCIENLFINEPDMLYFDLAEPEDKSVGRWYMRKSGTEPKISFNISVLQSYSEIASIWMKVLEQNISVLFRQSI